MGRLNKSLVAGLFLTCDLYVLTIIYDSFVSGDAAGLIWERTPLTLIVWWPVLLLGWPFKALFDLVLMLLSNVLLYALLVYSFMWWRARNVRLP